MGKSGNRGRNREIVATSGNRAPILPFCGVAPRGHRTAHVARRRLRGCGSVNTNPFFVRLRAQFEVNLEVVVIGSKFAHLLIAGIRALLVHPIIGQSQLTAQETFPAGWDAHHGTVYVLPETLIDDLDACVAAREAEEEESGLAEEEESDGDED